MYAYVHCLSKLTSLVSLPDIRSMYKLLHRSSSAAAAKQMFAIRSLGFCRVKNYYFNFNKFMAKDPS